MLFASINSTDPMTNFAQFRKNILRIDSFEKFSFFELAILDFFSKVFRKFFEIGLFKKQQKVGALYWSNMKVQIVACF